MHACMFICLYAMREYVWLCDHAPVSMRIGTKVSATAAARTSNCAESIAEQCCTHNSSNALGRIGLRRTLLHFHKHLLLRTAQHWISSLSCPLCAWRAHLCTLNTARTPCACVWSSGRRSVLGWAPVAHFLAIPTCRRWTCMPTSSCKHSKHAVCMCVCVCVCM
jgi:hypothetical protein